MDPAADAPSDGAAAEQGAGKGAPNVVSVEELEEVEEEAAAAAVASSSSDFGDPDVESAEYTELLQEDATGDLRLMDQDAAGVVAPLVHRQDGSAVARVYSLGDIHPSMLRRTLRAEAEAEVEDEGEGATDDSDHRGQSSSSSSSSEEAEEDAIRDVDEISRIAKRLENLEEGQGDRSSRKRRAASDSPIVRTLTPPPCPALPPPAIGLDGAPHETSPPHFSSPLSASPVSRHQSQRSIDFTLELSPLHHNMSSPAMGAHPTCDTSQSLASSSSSPPQQAEQPANSTPVSRRHRPKRPIKWADGVPQHAQQQPATTGAAAAALSEPRFVGPNATVIRMRLEQQKRQAEEQRVKRIVELQALQDRRNRVFDKETGTTYRIMSCDEFDHRVVLHLTGAADVAGEMSDHQEFRSTKGGATEHARKHLRTWQQQGRSAGRTTAERGAAVLIAQHLSASFYDLLAAQLHRPRSQSSADEDHHQKQTLLAARSGHQREEEAHDRRHVIYLRNGGLIAAPPSNTEAHALLIPLSRVE